MILITISFLNWVLRPRVSLYTLENYFASQVGKCDATPPAFEQVTFCLTGRMRYGVAPIHSATCMTLFLLVFCTPYDILRLRAYWSSVCCQEVPASWANVMFYCDESYITPQWLAPLPGKQKVPGWSQFPSI